jgi:hypothetical protein
MEIAVREAFGWLIEGDPRFAGGAASGNAP